MRITAKPWRVGATILALLTVIGLCAWIEAGAVAQPLTRSPDGRALQLTFSDDFDSFRRFSGRRGVWRTVYGAGRPQSFADLRTFPANKELELYVDPDLPGAKAFGDKLNPFSVEHGVLQITAEPAPPGTEGVLGGYRYVSGVITTQPSFAQTYGYFEMRAKLPAGKGIWPAFWMLPIDQSWPPEIDIVESIGDPGKAYLTAHSHLPIHSTDRVDIDPDEFHVFAVSWDADEIIWFIDGREVKRQATPADMHKPMFLLANLAVGGSWPGNPDATTPWPARFSIDYIRAYRFAP